MTDNDREQIALFRFSLISPILNRQVKKQNEYLAKVAAKKHNVPYYGVREYSPKTISMWVRAYRKGGFEGLKPKPRNDRGKSRVLTPELKEVILEAREEHPDRSVSLLYDQLITEKKMLPSQASYSTVYRFLKKKNLLVNSPRKEENRRRFAYDQVNMLWQGDEMYGPYLNLDGKKVKTFLFAFIDDCSRVITYAKFLTTEKFSAVQQVLSEAILRRGIPKLLYVDNGKVYRSDNLHFACASLGITLIHTKPYSPADKGKIERFYLTVRKRFLPLLTDEDLSSLDKLNKSFFKWLEKDYHRKVHSSLKMTPLDKYMSQISQVKTYDDPEKLKLLFLKRAQRKVRHDGTISVNSKLYQVPPVYIGKKVKIRFDQETYDNIYLYENGKCITKAEPVIMADNAHAKRGNPISFAKMTEGGSKNV
ncbi:Transposase InsO and inactivated derivatives [Halanaerobium congolense]|jgi:transposase InsO family protein|uniref:Transposase InsO and inactivated derivatives n=1 Tax=Halanaerobium congolense TaxID=54121 RepID=A0A1G7H7Y7_9FIRM|nr:helix-turn-helix domain-containing protein [Halanaerobium congolense]PTX17552.1 transposase InsO family protein [Halanaerobium congolense]SDE96229.1 Transposase InsO and inactivated derivatives [Halanaerobium congolense]SDI76058.1 Transposase InsO and inactivated derivatives [Halanaerobium congolense]SES75972.1 Transposase InsO and inactivated derivatives [Halanaerobium congolense]SET47387.1 Transposase InsO and inactivated derivatives [Halanaerobium congolense]